MTLMHRIIHLYPQARPPRQPSADHLHRPLLAPTHGSAIIDAVAIRGRGQPQTADKAALEKKTRMGFRRDIEEETKNVGHRALACATPKAQPLLRASAKMAPKQRAESSNDWRKVFGCHGSAEDGQGRAWPTRQVAKKSTNNAAGVASQKLKKLVESDDVKMTTPTEKAAAVGGTKRLPLVSAASRPSQKKRKAELVETIKDYREEANLLKHGRTLVDPGNRKHYVVVPKEAFSEWIDNVLSTPDAVKTAMQRALDGKTGHPSKDTGS